MIGDEPNNTDPLQKLRAALLAKAKSNPKFRFSGTTLARDRRNLVREPDAGNPPVRFDEREVETESRGHRL